MIFCRIERVERRADNFVPGIGSCMVPFRFWSIILLFEDKGAYLLVLNLIEFLWPTEKSFRSASKGAVVPSRKRCIFRKSYIQLRNVDHVNRACCKSVFAPFFLRVYVKRLCNYPSQYNILYNVATIGRHYTHRNLRSQTIRALIYARHQNHAPQSGAIVFLLLTIFFY